MKQAVIWAKNYHKVLGLRKGASQEEIKKAFRRLALIFHPDRNSHPEASGRFREISEAYAVLSGKEKAPIAQGGQSPEHRTRNRQSMGPYDEWAAQVSRIWMMMENERNGSYL